MSPQRVRAHSISISLDGFMAGADQSLERPLGAHGPLLHRWMFATRTGHEMQGRSGGSTGLDDEKARGRMDNAGATLMGRNMFGPIRGPWEDSEPWEGWWGDTPPYHHPVVVLTHYEREPLELDGTTFYFETGGVDAGLARARALAGEKDVIVGGGASTIRQLLARRAIDSLHVALVPVLFSRGESIWPFEGFDLEHYEVTAFEPSDDVVHVTFAPRARTAEN